MSPPLFLFPNQAEFNRVLPKSKIYEHARPTRSIQELFVAQVEKIVWKYKLSPETINLPASPNVPEIQIFSVSLKTTELSESVLRTIDNAIPFPIFFELSHGKQIKPIAAYKRPNNADSTKWIVDDYFDMSWQPLEISRDPLPVALDLASLYEQLLRRHISLPARSGESLKDQVQRANVIRTKESQSRKLETRIQQEIQFNRKVELNRELRELKNELNSLLGPL